MIKGKVLALILAGGQGSRLLDLTKKTAKPAVHFGGKYRIIDFALSNCANSGINDVGILTQYQPLALNAHIGIGVPWDLDRRIGGVEMLPPYQSTEGGRWYKGTANAIFENIDYIDSVDPEYVLILSGDHIYKMDYSEMIQHHKSRDADLTISVIEVPWEDTNRFGILNTREDGSIYEFEEKPEKAKNNLASMGIYVFNWDVLRSHLIKDQQIEGSNHDFGKDIIPQILEDQLNIQAFRFSGYWKDVGTVESYWQANMDLLDPKNMLNLNDEDWRIFTKNYDMAPHYISKSGDVDHALLNEGCVVRGKVYCSILSTEVEIGEGSIVQDSVLLPNVIVGKNCVIKKAIIMSGNVIEDGTTVGTDDGSITMLGSKDLSLLG